MRRQRIRFAGTTSSNARTGGFARLGLAICAALSAALLFGATGASAAPVPLGDPFDGSGTPAGSMTPTKMAVDQSTGDLWVIDAAHDVINRFSSTGNYEAQIKGSDTTAGSFGFSATASDAIAVDPTTGDIYVTAESGKNFKFDSSGGEIWEQPAIGSNCGVAIDPSGNPWVADYYSGLIELDASKGEPTGDTIAVGDQPCQIAFSGTGDVFVAKYQSALLKWDSSGESIGECQSEPGWTFDVETDPLTGDVFAPVFDAGKLKLKQWDSSCSLAAAFTFPSYNSDAFPGVAVNGSERLVYVGEAGVGGDGRVHVFGISPTVSPLAPTNVSARSVTLNGTVDPGGAAVTDCHFDVSTDASFATGVISVPCVPADLGTGTAPVPVSADVTGLKANTAYHSRLVAENLAGPSETGDVTFKTKLQPPPTVTTGVASDITQTAAKLAGTVNPNSDATSCKFQYGVTTSYGSEIATAAPGSGSAMVAVSATPSGLSANTEYHFRLVCTGSGGPATGSDATFRTASPPVDPPVVNPPVTKPPVVDPEPLPPRNEAAYKVCVKKAVKVYAKAKARAKSGAAKKAAKARKKKAIKKCAARYL